MATVPEKQPLSQMVVRVKPGDSSVVTEYQVGNFTHIYMAECFVGQPQIYTGFMGKVLTLAHIPLKLGMRSAIFSRYCLDSIFTDSIETVVLDAYFYEPDTIVS